MKNILIAISIILLAALAGLFTSRYAFALGFFAGAYTEKIAMHENNIELEVNNE